MSLTIDVQAHAGTFSLDVAFATEAGATAVLGASGAGKTLTLRAIAGLLRPDAGRVAVGGSVLFDSAAGIDVAVRRRRVGLVFQDYALFPHLSVAANLAFGLRGSTHAAAAEAVSRVVGMLGLQGLEGRRPGALSGGQRQRVALGRALAPGPDLLLLDEPFTALDAPARVALVQEFAALRSRIELPVVLVTHDVGEAHALAEHLVVLENGRVLQEGPKERLFDAPESPEVARLLGVQNLVPGVVLDVRDGRAGVDAGGLLVRAPAGNLRPGSPVTAGIRAVDLLATPASAAGGGNATLVRTIDRGATNSIVLRLEGGAEVVAELERETAVRLGSALPARWSLRAREGFTHLWPAG